jgi:hypothetical protein
MICRKSLRLQQQNSAPTGPHYQVRYAAPHPTAKLTLLGRLVHPRLSTRFRRVPRFRFTGCSAESTPPGLNCCPAATLPPPGLAHETIGFKPERQKADKLVVAINHIIAGLARRTPGMYNRAVPRRGMAAAESVPRAWHPVHARKVGGTSMRNPTVGRADPGAREGATGAGAGSINRSGWPRFVEC